MWQVCIRKRTCRMRMSTYVRYCYDSSWLQRYEALSHIHLGSSLNYWCSHMEWSISIFSISRVCTATLTVKSELPKFSLYPTSISTMTPLHVATLTVQRELPKYDLYPLFSSLWWLQRSASRELSYPWSAEGAGWVKWLRQALPCLYPAPCTSWADHQEQHHIWCWTRCIRYLLHPQRSEGGALRREEGDKGNTRWRVQHCLSMGGRCGYWLMGGASSLKESE